MRLWVGRRGRGDYSSSASSRVAFKVFLLCDIVFPYMALGWSSNLLLL